MTYNPSYTGNPITTNTVFPFAPPPQITFGPGGASQGVIGHETGHAWQRYSWNPIAVISRVTDAARILGAAVTGKQFDPKYGSLFSQEGQASAYYGPPGSTYNTAPQWWKHVAMSGFKR